MSRVVNLSCRIFLCLGILSPIQMAVAADEDIVFVRKDCSSIGSNQQCFNTMKELEGWLWNTRKPTANSRVSVHIGPGDFTQQPGSSNVFDCKAGNGFISLIGSGPTTTRLFGEGNALIATDCTDLHVQDMTLETTGSYTIRWMGGGSSRWTNVDVKGKWQAWLDQPIDCNGANPIHYWFNSRLQHDGSVPGGATYQTGCGESWLYASEITYSVEATAMSSAVLINNDADVRLFGSVIRAIVSPGSNPTAHEFIPVTGVIAKDNGVFHMHGGIISLNVSPLTQNIGVSGIENYGSGTMHTPGIAFALEAAGTGEVRRIWKQGSGPVLSPFTWPPGATPPSLAASGTLNGSDMFVETDCDSSGDCSGSSSNPQHPHLMVYDSTCITDGPWFDSTRGKCRGEP